MQPFVVFTCREIAVALVKTKNIQQSSSMPGFARGKNILQPVVRGCTSLTLTLVSIAPLVNNKVDRSFCLNGSGEEVERGLGIEA